MSVERNQVITELTVDARDSIAQADALAKKIMELGGKLQIRLLQLTTALAVQPLDIAGARSGRR